MLKNVINNLHVVMGMKSKDDSVTATTEDKVFMYGYYSTLTILTLFLYSIVN